MTPSTPPPLLASVLHEGRRVPIGPAGLTIGRDGDNDIVLGVGRVSRHHARIYADDDGLWVEDLGSTNGTLLNGERFTAAARRLELSQPAVSTQVSELEQRLGLRLIERVGKKAFATPAGLEVIAHARRIAERFNALPPGAVRQAKQLMRGPQNELLLKTIRSEGEIFAGRLRSPEAMEAFQAFFQKRKPDFSKFQ